MNATPKSAIRIDGPSFSLQLEASFANGCAVVRCHGKLVAQTADFFKTEVIRRIDHCKLFTLDLNELTYLDGSGWRALFSVFTSAQRADCEFRVLNTNPRLADLLERTSLATVPKSTDDYWISILSSG